MIADGVIYIVDSTGALSVIRNSGLSGYGTAAWPRYRPEGFVRGASKAESKPSGCLSLLHHFPFHHFYGAKKVSPASP